MSYQEIDLRPRFDSSQTTSTWQPATGGGPTSSSSVLSYSVSGPRIYHSDVERSHIIQDILIEHAELWERLAKR